ncbi:MAG: hypothetical protein JXM70_20800 [Pirellulales bacterium]|nr:hypothetical protein [Pirellulales bacterium]
MKKNHWIAVSQAHVAEIFGVKIKTVQNWAAAGMPGTPGKMNRPGRYPLKDIIRWLRTSGPWQPPPAMDSMLDGENSPALERYRLARARTVELELAEKKAKLLDPQKIRLMFSRMPKINQCTGNRLEKAFGKRARKMFESGIESATREVSELLCEHE